jgi:hypothetical protein
LPKKRSESNDKYIPTGKEHMDSRFRWHMGAALFIVRALRVAARLPFTLLMLSWLALAALLTNTYFEAITHHWLNRMGFAPRDLWYWRLERLFTSALVTSGGRVFWEAVLFIALVVGFAEWQTGWRRTAATFWGVHLVTLVLTSLLISLAIHQLRRIGLEASEVARDVGPSAGYFACLGLLSARLRHPWRLATGILLLLSFSVALLLPPGTGENPPIKFAADLAHLVAFPLGWFSAVIGATEA